MYISVGTIIQSVIGSVVGTIFGTAMSGRVLGAGNDIISRENVPLQLFCQSCNIEIYLFTSRMFALLSRGNVIERWLTRRTIVTAVGFALLAAASGVIGNGMYAVFIWLWDHTIRPLWEQVAGSLMTNSWPLVFTSAVSLVALSTCIVLWKHSRVLYNALNTTNDVVELDDSLLRLLASLICANDMGDQMQRILEELLRDAIRTFPGDVYRASVLFPDTKKEYLHIWAHYQMPEESVKQVRFYIGKEESRRSERGIAGATYLDGQLRVGHMVCRNGRWECDQKEYIEYDPRRPHPSYYSFVSVPIIGLASDPASRGATSCLGVVCFDSHSSSVFDSSQIQTLLLAFGRRIAAGMAIYMQLLPPQDQPASV